jgi:hypothetical protein
MSNESKKEYIAFLRKRYRISSRKEKAVILDELVRNFEMHRKAAIRLMLPKRPEKKKRGRVPTYSFAVVHHLRILWRRMDFICSKKIVAALPFWLPYYDCAADIKSQLLRLSHATIDRFLQPYRAQHKRNRNSGTKPGRLMKNLIPVKPLDWNITVPGFLEADSVAHCGDSLSGEFAWSITFTDVYSGWTANRSVWRNTGLGVLNSTKSVEESLPFPLLGFSTDNGTEFLTHDLISYFSPQEFRHHRVKFNRGRPYKKNDQCHVEQKNWTHVRQLLGYARIDDPQIVELINDMYINDWGPYQNFFIPQVKLIRKTRVGARYRREYTKPMTPYQRLLLSPSIMEEKKQDLHQQYAQLNPFELRTRIDAKLRRILTLIRKPKANPIEHGACA